MLPLLVGLFCAALLFSVVGGDREEAEPEEPDPPIDGDEGDDTLSGTAGDDLIRGFAGNDSLSGDAGDDTLDGGSGADRVEGGAGSDTLYARGGVDALFGGAGDDLLDGRSDDDADPSTFSADRLDGGDGDDTLLGDGNELMIGGEGADDFTVFAGAQQTAEIADFQPGQDRIVVRYDPAQGVPYAEIEPDEAGQNFFINVNGAYLARIQGEFGINGSDIVVVPVGDPVALR